MIEILEQLPPSATIVRMDDEIVFIKAGWSDAKYPDAKQRRDKTARELRKVGFKVKSTKWDFTDLARCIRFELEATRPGWEWKMAGGWRRVE